MAIVTGAGQGIGLEIAEQLVVRGTKVILNDIVGLPASGASDAGSRERAAVAQAID